MISIIATDTTVFTLGVIVLLMFIDQIYRIIFLKYVKKNHLIILYEEK